MNKQSGFTLIELVLVIVILGILAATALPKFANLSTDAESAAASGARGAVASAMAIGHSAFLINSTITAIEGTNVTFVNGYPSGDNADTGTIADIAGLDASDFTIADNNANPAVLTVTKGACSFTYTEATATASPIISAVTGSGC